MTNVTLYLNGSIIIIIFYIYFNFILCKAQLNNWID